MNQLKSFLYDTLMGMAAVGLVLGAIVWANHAPAPLGPPTPAPIVTPTPQPTPAPQPALDPDPVHVVPPGPLLPVPVQTAMEQLQTDLAVFTAAYAELQIATAALAAAQDQVGKGQDATSTAQEAVTRDQTSLAAAIAAAFGGQPAPQPAPPKPDPPQPPDPPVQSSTLRCLFSYNPDYLIMMGERQKSILTSPSVRNYLDKHCPLESACANGQCPTGKCPQTLSPFKAAQSPSYRFWPTSGDPTSLPAMWQPLAAQAAKHTEPWLLVVDQAGRTVINQTWPGSPDETVALLARYGGP